MLSIVLSATLLLALPVPAGDGQAPGPKGPAREAQLQAWLAAVHGHEPGTLGEGGIEIASWAESRLAEVVEDIDGAARFLASAHARLGRTARPPMFAYAGRSLTIAEVQQLLGLADAEARRGDVNRLVRRGALLHTDIAVTLDRLDPLAQPSPPPTGPGAVLLLDGEQKGISDRGPHWRIARSLLDLIPAASSSAASRREWYVATAAYMRSRTLMADQVPHLAKARALLPGDPDVLFHLGAMHETLAAPFIQQAVQGVRLPAGVQLDVTDARTHLQAARTFFRRALEASPDRVEPRVRLGRVLGVLGQHEEAVRELQRALDDRGSPALEYYAALFLGGEQAKQGQFELARRSYAHAVALYPRAQSPRLGLSTLARMEGRPADARAVLLDALAGQRKDDPSRDPWWTYFTSPKDEADRLLDTWRRTVPQGHGR